MKEKRLKFKRSFLPCMTVVIVDAIIFMIFFFLIYLFIFLILTLMIVVAVVMVVVVLIIIIIIIINHIISESSKLAQKKYKTRHDKVRKVIHWELSKKF